MVNPTRGERFVDRVAGDRGIVLDKRTIEKDPISVVRAIHVDLLLWTVNVHRETTFDFATIWCPADGANRHDGVRTDLLVVFDKQIGGISDWQLRNIGSVVGVVFKEKSHWQDSLRPTDS